MEDNFGGFDELDEAEDAGCKSLLSAISCFYR
jgi:hypothetical protein